MKGVYTSKCPGCRRVTVLHVDGNKLDPASCRGCSTEFTGIKDGERLRTYVLTTDKILDEKPPALEEEETVIENAEVKQEKPKKKWKSNY